MVLNLEKVGIKIEVHHHEVGTAGQSEIDMRFDTLLKTADNVLKYKYVVKNTAWQAGKTVTFMPKPLFHGQRLGHAHAPEPVDATTRTCSGTRSATPGSATWRRWYIGGLLAHAPSLLAFTNPTTNSYRRLVPGYEAPINLVYCQRNRCACIRIPVFSKTARRPSAWSSARRTRCATRTSRSRAMLMAGLDGIKNKIEPPEPMDKDLYDLPPEEKAMVKQVPGSLEEVLDNLESDHQWLLEGGVFTQDVIDTWIDYKRTNELDAVRLRPHPYEFHLYYDM